MQYIGFAILMLLALPQTSLAEAWEFSCTEAVSLLKAAQDQVVQKHDQLQEAKFSLRHPTKVFDGCRKSRKGFQGGKILCVSHQSKQGKTIKDILVAQRTLETSLKNFQEKIEGVLQSCPVSSP